MIRDAASVPRRLLTSAKTEAMTTFCLSVNGDRSLEAGILLCRSGTDNKRARRPRTIRSPFRRAESAPLTVLGARPVIRERSSIPQLGILATIAGRNKQHSQENLPA